MRTQFRKKRYWSRWVVPALSVACFTAYREMLLIRRFEEKAGQLYGMGLIGGFCHLYIGQEAVVVGMQMAMKIDGDR
jgi:pyruvate dehydrogenase E1 component alpha subunit